MKFHLFVGDGYKQKLKCIWNIDRKFKFFKIGLENTGILDIEC